MMTPEIVGLIHYERAGKFETQLLHNIHFIGYITDKLQSKKINAYHCSITT